MTEVHNPMRLRNRMKRGCRPRIIHATRQKPRRTAHAVLLLALAAPDWAAAQDAIDFAPDYIGNFVGVGVGGVPDYIGSNDYQIGAAPLARISLGHRHLEVTANFVSANLLDHPNWRLGPAATLRLGRDDVDDVVVDALPAIDPTLELGAVAGYALQTGEDPRSRLAFKVGFTHDVADVHGGFVVSGSVRAWLPVGQFGAMGLAIGSTWGSSDYTGTYFSVSPLEAEATGLTAFEAGSGFRDVRATALFVHPVSDAFLLGVGGLYGRMLGEAGRSPITDDRGSRNQFIFGVGTAYFW